MRALLVVMGTSLALKLVLIWLVTGMPCSQDQCDYLTLADGVLAGGGQQPHDGYLWPPGQIHFLALMRGVFGTGLTPPRVAQALVSTLSVPLIFLLGRRLSGTGCGLVAATLFAFYPNLVAFTHLLWPATWYIFFLLFAFWLILRHDSPSPADLVGAGLALGMAAVFKGQALYFGILAAAWLALRVYRTSPPTTSPARRARGASVAAGLLILGLLLPVLPWTVRNALAHHRLALLDASAGRNLYIGTNIPPPANWDLGFGDRRRVDGGRPRCDNPNIIDRDRCEVRNALRFMASHPGHMLERVPLKIADLLNPSSFLIRHVRLDKYPRRFGRLSAMAVTILAAGTWMGIALLGTAGFVLLPFTPGRRLMLLFLLYNLLLHSVTFGLTRFRLPLVPFLILAAAPLLTPGGLRVARRARPWRRVLATGLMLILLGLFGSRVGTIFDLFTGAPVIVHPRHGGAQIVGSPALSARVETEPPSE